MPPHLCQSCKQNPATIHLTEILNEEKREVHVCEACAQNQGLSSGPLIPNLPSMLASLVKGAKSNAPAPRCPTCGISFAEFREKGRLGCPHDYEFFADHLTPLLEKIHGATQHKGRLPKGTGPAADRRSEKLLGLRRDLQQAVKAEQYEAAARLRDEIRSIEDAVVAATAASGADAAAQAAPAPSAGPSSPPLPPPPPPREKRPRRSTGS